MVDYYAEKHASMMLLRIEGKVDRNRHPTSELQYVIVLSVGM